MRILCLLLALLLSVESVQGMQDSVEDIQRQARRCVRHVVFENVGRDSPFRWTLSDPSFVDQLNTDIIKFLRDGTDPAYSNYPNSFTGVVKALAEIGISLSEDKTTLKKRS